MKSIIAALTHLLPRISNTSLCLPHLLGPNELWGLLMILVPAELSTEKRFASSVCIGDKPKTDTRMGVRSHYRHCYTDVPAYAKRNKTICIHTCNHVSHLVWSPITLWHVCMQTNADALDVTHVVFEQMLRSRTVTAPPRSRSSQDGGFPVAVSEAGKAEMSPVEISRCLMPISSLVLAHPKAWYAGVRGTH